MYDSSSGLWDPERWVAGKTRSDSPFEKEGRSKRERPPDLDRDPGMKRKTSGIGVWFFFVAIQKVGTHVYTVIQS